jgi:tRNA threonylcarbamoyl adenosine modification protein YeaZ
MIWLSLDLSSPLGALALHQDGRLLKEVALGDSYQHTERLLPALRDLLHAEGMNLPDVGRFVTVAGPGSFTGLRIAMATLKAFAMVTQAPIDCVSGAEIRALAYVAQHSVKVGTKLTVLTFVASGRFVVSRFSVVADGVQLASESVETELADRDPIVLNDDRTPIADTISYPLRARYLAEQLTRARSRKTAASLAEWIALTPAYFGSSHFD